MSGAGTRGDLRRATVFAPGTIGNVGPGFDVLGLTLEGIGDTVTVEITNREPIVVEITGVDADDVPREPEKNVAAIAAMAYLRAGDVQENVAVWLQKGLPLGGGLGGSAASSVGGALAAAYALGGAPDPARLLAAAVAGEEAATGGRHLDNVAPCILGGLGLVRSSDPIDVLGLPAPEDWWVALVTPELRIETREARRLLPDEWSRAEWIQQMANTAGLVAAFLAGDAELARRSLVDRFAEPRRAHLIPRFYEVQAAALDAGALGCSISGSGPTLFALTEGESAALACEEAMRRAFEEVPALSHVCRIGREGARRV